MDSITIRLPKETLEEISSEAERRDISKSEVIREWFRKRDELQSECAELRTECEQLQTECDRLRDEYEEQIDELEREIERVHREKRLILEQREEHTELVNTVERQQSLAERKARAGLLTKTKWALFGMKDEESD